MGEKRRGFDNTDTVDIFDNFDNFVRILTEKKEGEQEKESGKWRKGKWRKSVEMVKMSGVWCASQFLTSLS